MKERLYTIELTDAVKADDECMFCWLERKLERETLEFVLGSSYMESDIREETSTKGFCRHHTKMMFDYGNTLGNAWILKSHLEYRNKNLKAQMKQRKPEAQVAGTTASGWFSKIRGAGRRSAAMSEQIPTCYMCGRMQNVYARMLDTFVFMLHQDASFGELLMQSKGFCFAHFQDILTVCGEKLPVREQEIWLPRLTELMSSNLDRVQEDINWLIEKYDYRNKDADWKQSKDAVQRTMQKLTGGHPADSVFQNQK